MLGGPVIVEAALRMTLNTAAKGLLVWLHKLG